MAGSIRQRGKESWQIIWDAPRGEDGKRRQMRQTVKGSRQDAEEHLEWLLSEQQEGHRAAKAGLRYLYAIVCGDTVKIGIAANPMARLRNLQGSNPWPLTLLWTIGPRTQKSAFNWESRIHAHFAPENIRGEWFNFTEEIANLPAQWEFPANIVEYPNGFFAPVPPTALPVEEEPTPEAIEEPLPPRCVEPKPSYDPREAAILLGLSEAEVESLIEAKSIPVLRLADSGFALKGKSSIRIRHRDLGRFHF